MHLPDSPAWKSKQSKKKKALREEQERYVVHHRSHSEPASSGLAPGSPTSSWPKAKMFGGKSTGDREPLAGDDVFAAMVLRQAQLRKRAATMQHRRSESPARLVSKGSNVEAFSKNEPEERQMSHQECAAEIIAELDGAMRGRSRSHSQMLSQDLRPVADHHWPTSPATQREMGLRNSNSFQSERQGFSELRPSPWQALVHQHRETRQRSEAEREKAEKAAADSVAAPASERRQSCSNSEASSESMEEGPKKEPSVPSYDHPGKEPPPPPPMPPHLQQFVKNKKEREAFEREEALRQERREREREHRRACKKDRHENPTEWAWQDRQKKRKRRPQTTPQSDPAGAPPEMNTSDSEIESSRSSWRPWRCFFPRRSHKVSMAGRARQWGREWRWGSGKVAPDGSSHPSDGEPAAQDDTSGAPAVDLPGDTHVSEIDEELDRTRGLSQQERKKIFRELQRRLHPDKNPTDQDAAKLRFQYLMDNRTSFLKA